MASELVEIRDRLADVVQELGRVHQAADDHIVIEMMRPIRSELLELHESIHQLSLIPPWE